MLAIYSRVNAYLTYVLTRLRDEEGVETIEWIGLAAVILVLLAAIAAVLGKDTKVGQAIVDALARMIENITGG